MRLSRVVLLDDAGQLLRYAMQDCEWPDHQPPPPPADFDLAAVGRAHASYKTGILPTGPSFGLKDWEVIKDALNLLAGTGSKDAARLVRSARGHCANLRKREEKVQR